MTLSQDGSRVIFFYVYCKNAYNRPNINIFH